ncbi:MAG: SPOR domain-containing protein, partial [Thermaurantiacus sp.]
MIRATCVALAILVAAPAAATVAAGVAKWRAGDWPGAVAEWAGPASRGDPDALFNMGQAHNLGRGVPQNRATAQDYYRRAADKGHVAATANLGISLWQDGRRAEALPHLRRAADQGDPRASFVLGVAIFNGDGAPRNQTLGYAYMLRAREGGLTQANQQAARMATLMTSDTRSRGEAVAAALAAGEPVPSDLIGGRPVAVAAATPPPAQSRIVVQPTPPGAAGPQGEPSPALAETEVASAPTEPGSGDEPVAGDGWRVQLGAFQNESAARTAWATLMSQAGQLLDGARPLFATRGGLVRLQVGPFADRSAARDL